MGGGREVSPTVEIGANRRWVRERGVIFIVPPQSGQTVTSTRKTRARRRAQESR